MLKKHLLALAVLMTFVAPNFAQTTINVPSQSPSILSALALAQSGDTILVAPGTYNVANINFTGRDIILASSGGPQVTTIDGLGNPRIMLFNSGETSAAVVNGFTIRGGQTGNGAAGTNVSPDGENGADGGAVLIVGSSPTFIDCVFTNNATGNGGDAFDPALGDPGAHGGDAGRGGAVFIDGGSPTFSGCSFSNNSTGNGGAGKGTGFPDAMMNPTVGNGGEGGHGGAVYINDGTVSFTNCTFDNNLCGNGGLGSNGDSLGADSGAGGVGGSGGGLYLNMGAATVDSCLFSINSCGLGGTSGGGLGSESQPGGDGGAGGAVCSTGTSIVLTRSAFSANVAGKGGVGGFSGGFFGLTGTCGIGGFGGNGGAVSVNGNHTIDACAFIDNTAGDGGNGGQGFGVPAGVGGFGGSGGAISISGGTGGITNAIIVGNIAGNGADSGASDISLGGAGNAGVAGGILIIAGNVQLGSSNILENSAGFPGVVGFPGGPGLGGGILAFGGTLNVGNSIIRDNLANNVTGNIFDLGLGVLTVDYCDVEGGYAGTGNFDLDPAFLNPIIRDYHLKQESPCRDAGDLSAGIIQATDFDGDNRVVCGQIDVGADEFDSMLNPIGQASRPGLATLDIYAVGEPKALSPCGNPVSSGDAGPYRTVFDQGATFNFDVGGEPFRPLVLMWGDLNLQVATYGPAIGQFDIGGPLDPVSGIPSALTVFQDGTGLYIPGGGYWTDATGLNSTSYVMPAFGAGVLTTFQAIMYHAGGIALTNAVQIVLNP